MLSRIAFRWCRFAQPPATGCDPVGIDERANPIPGWCGQIVEQGDQLVGMRAFYAGTLSGCVLFRIAFRWCRFAQPPATGCDPFGISAKIDRHPLGSATKSFRHPFVSSCWHPFVSSFRLPFVSTLTTPEGFKACSRGLSAAVVRQHALPTDSGSSQNALRRSASPSDSARTDYRLS